MTNEGLATTKRHSHSGQIGKRIARIGTMWVDDGDGTWQDLGRQMMIGDDDIYPELTCVFDLLHTANTAVCCDDEAHTPGLRPLDGRITNVVAISPAMRHKHLHIGAEPAQQTSP